MADGGQVTAAELDMAQRLRLRRTLFAIGGGAGLSVVVFLLFIGGAMRGGTVDFAMLMTAFWLVNMSFVAAILSGANLRLRDPSMTLSQMLWATVSTFAFVYLTDEGRHLILMVYLLAMMFGAFRLDVSEYLVVTLVAVLLYALVIASLHRAYPASIDVREEFLQWLVFFLVMVGFSLLGSETSRLRSILQRRGQELRKARDAAAVAYQAKSRFLAATSHELRTPLNVILGAADLIEDGQLTREQRAALDRARHAGAHLLALVNSMIDFSKLESGSIELRRVPLDLREELEAVRAMVAPQAESRGIGLHVHVDPRLPPRVDGDGMRLNEVLVHLLNNAVRFTRKGEVRLSAERGAGEAVGVRFTVTDTGVGIEPERLATLFQPFARAGGNLSRAGAGLGLALCWQLVDLMGGRLEVASTPGAGSRFSFELPLPRVEVMPSSPPRAGAARRVLVVDDSADNRMLLRAFLKDFADVLDEAEDGSVGVRKFSDGHYDVVLMDMHMPRMDGIEATRAIRELERVRGSAPTAILALTADDSVNDRQRSLDAGCDDHLVKPVSKKTLLSTLAAHLPAP